MIKKNIVDSIDSSKVPVLLILSGGCTIAGIVWGSMYAFLGLNHAMWLPYIFSLVVGTAFLMYFYLKKVKILLYAQLSMILIIPTSLQWSLGGIHQSGLVILWALMAPLGSIVFEKNRRYLYWTALYFLTVIVSIYFDDTFLILAPKKVEDTVIQFFYGMNVVTVSLVTFVAIFYYDFTLNKEKIKLESYMDELNSNIDILLNSIEKTSKGDLTFTINRTHKDPIINRLFSGYDSSMILMKSLMTKLKESTYNVSDSITTINLSLQNLVQKVDEYSRGINRLEGFIHIVQADLGDIAELVRRTTSQANINLNSAKLGEEHINKTVVEINSISNVMSETNQIMQELEKKTSEIDIIINSINEIADSTNLLSLNASIEAARAGEHGLGFSVVAKEIGKLTNLTTDSTKKITSKVKEIQSFTKKAAANFQNANKLMSHGLGYIKETEGSIHAILTSTNNVHKIIERLSEYTNEQLNKVTTISTNVINLISQLKDFLDEINRISNKSNDLENTANDMITSINHVKL